MIVDPIPFITDSYWYNQHSNLGECRCSHYCDVMKHKALARTSRNTLDRHDLKHSPETTGIAQR